MARMRFSKTEKEFLATLKPGDEVEWRNVTQWHPAYVKSAEIITDGKFQTVTITNRATTKCLSYGRVIPVGPGAIRPATVQASPAVASGASR